MAPWAPSQLQRRVWDRRVDTWDHEGVPGLDKVVAAIVSATEARAGMTAVDLGCGSGQVSIPLAEHGVQVTAVDVSPQMIQRLNERVAGSDVAESMHGVVCAIENFTAPRGSVDLVVSNYALHHLRDRDKQAVLVAAVDWLRPGGKLVVGDMMFGRGATARDRAIIGSKVAVLVRRGPGGWWRVAKNAVRFLLRIQERPCSMDTWVRYFEEAGLTSVTTTSVIAEAAVVAGTRP
jgi:2-polyprenyl-3-methyl-5-hydroxy-6-metoxy-1,4-benzoquinol methylase